MTALEIRPLTPADRAAALAVINEAARWHRDFLPAGEVHDPEMTPEPWEGETRRMNWYGAFVRGRLDAPANQPATAAAKPPSARRRGCGAANAATTPPTRVNPAPA